MRNVTLGAVLAAVVVAAVIAYNTLFSVYETQQALVLQFGKVVDVIKSPGLHHKAPFIQNVVYIDRRILDLDSPAQEVIAADQKRLVVDTFARYRIVDPLLFYQSVQTVQKANAQLSQLLNSATRRVLGEATFTHVVRDERPQLMARIAEQMNHESRPFGIDVVDVRIRRADLPEANSQAIFHRMQTERQREAAEIRAQGEEAARRIRARADRDVIVLLAEANKTSEQVRGEGDAKRNQIFAEAYGRDPGFFSFYRSMQAYEAALKGSGTHLVLTPDSDFFRFLTDPRGATATGGAGKPPAQPGGAPAQPAPEARGAATAAQ